ncbi:MAG: hypothetical protein DCC75_13630 [Proteobacteria bacterium]|nr:MAG: hypothetical protein DCC75_13630 [Pseudomonadota bacterium]
MNDASLLAGMKRCVTLLLTAAFLTIFSTKIAAQIPDKKIVKIGFVLPLSSDWAYLGEDVRDAVILAKEERALTWMSFPAPQQAQKR